MPLQPTTAPQPDAASERPSAPDAEQDGYTWGGQLELPLGWPGDDS